MDSFKFSYKTDKKETILVNVYNSGYQKCEAGYKMGPLIRSRYLVHHVVSGKGYYIVNDTLYSIQQGDTFLIYPNTVVSYYADKADPWEYYWVGFDGADVKMLMGKTDFTPLHPVVTTGHPDELKEMLLRIYEASGAEFYRQVQMSGYLYLFLSLLVKYASKQEEPVDISLEYTKQAVEYISQNYAKPITVIDVASSIGISRSHLYRVFVRNMSVSPQSYLENYRIRQSRVLLERTALSIGEVAHSVGYEDPLHFSKVFKKHSGTSPAAYKKASLRTHER